MCMRLCVFAWPVFADSRELAHYHLLSCRKGTVCAGSARLLATPVPVSSGGCKRPRLAQLFGRVLHPSLHLGTRTRDVRVAELACDLPVVQVNSPRCIVAALHISLHHVSAVLFNFLLLAW